MGRCVVVERELNVQPRQAPFAHHRGQVGGGIPDSNTAPEGAAVYRNIRANLLALILRSCRAQQEPESSGVYWL